VDSSRSAAFTRVFTVTLNAGDTITLSDNTAVAVTDTLTVGSNTQTFSTPGSASFTVTTSGPYTVTASGNFSPIIGTVTLSCVAGTASSVQQQANNAQIAITNGLRTLQNYQEWVTKGLQGSFGMTRGGDTASTRIDPAIRQARVRVETLTRRERELTEEIADASDTQRTDLEHERRDVQRQLAFAKVNAGVAGAPAYQVAAASDGTKTAAPSSFSLDACDLASCDPNDPQAHKWNAWAEGRVMGLTDSIARQSTLGFAGTAGVDYKFQPWLALGFSLGVENYETRFNLPGVRSGQTGVTVRAPDRQQSHPSRQDLLIAAAESLAPHGRCGSVILLSTSLRSSTGIDAAAAPCRHCASAFSASASLRRTLRGWVSGLPTYLI